MINYALPKEKLMIIIMPEMKKYMRMILTEELQEKMQMQSQDPRLMVKQFVTDDYLELGRDVGREAST